MAKQLVHYEHLDTVPRPVAGMAKKYPAGYKGYRHHHARAQFLYSASGSMRLTMDLGRWIIPPRRAVWIPAGYIHQTGNIGELEMRSLYIDPMNKLETTPDAPRMLRVSALLHELVLRVIDMPIEYDEHGHDGQIVQTLLGEIDWTSIHPVSLPSLKEERLQRLERWLLRYPGDRNTVEQWAAKLQISPRTLTRLVLRETDLSFQVWRDHIRTFVAIPMLTEGRSLAEIADFLGYDTAWGFTSMFKRVTDRVPSQYL